MHVEIANRFEDIDIPAAEWERLLCASDTHSIFQTYQWLKSWWTVFGCGQELLFFKVYDGTELLGFAPLMRTQDGLSAGTIKFIGDPHADYCDFVIGRDKPAVVATLLDALRQQIQPWDVMSLHNLPEASGTTRLLHAACDRLDYHTLVERRTSCHSLVIEGQEPEVEQLTRKYSLRRPRNYFSRQGKLVVRDIQDTREAAAYLDAFFEQHINRWRDTHTPSLFLRPENRHLYRQLLRDLHPQGRVLFSVVEFEEHPLAFHFGFDYNGSVLWYKPSFDVAFHKRSPGLVMLHHLIERSYRDRRHELDFTVGDEEFKHRFANTERYNLNLKVFRQHRSYLLESAYRATRGLAKTAAKKTLQVPARLGLLPR